MKANPDLFNRWKNFSDDFRSISSIVQNDIHLTEEMIREWIQITNRVQKRIIETKIRTLAYLENQLREQGSR